MLLALVILFIVLFILAFIFEWETVSITSGVLGLTCILIALFPIYDIVNGRVIDEKIAMYTEENIAIEQSIDEVVSEYMEYESTTFENLKSDSGIILVSLYPELKSDTLVQTQIETYLENTAKIKQLKESKINISNAKWWLYFGE